MGKVKEKQMNAEYEGCLEPTSCDYETEDWYNSLYAETKADRIDSHEGLGKRAYVGGPGAETGGDIRDRGRMCAGSGSGT